MKIRNLIIGNRVTLSNNEKPIDILKKFIDFQVDDIALIDENGDLINVIKKNDVIKLILEFGLENFNLSKIPLRDIQTIDTNDDVGCFEKMDMKTAAVFDGDKNFIGILNKNDLNEQLLTITKKEVDKLRTIINSSNNGVIIIDTDGKISCFNKAALKILGLDKESVGEKHIKNVFPEFETKTISELTQKIHKEKMIYGDKFLIYDFIPFKLEDEIAGATILLQDISSFENVLNELKANREVSERLNRIIEDSYDGIYITDGDANTLRINEAYERITGLKRENMLDKNMKDLVNEGYISESGSLFVLEKKKTISLNQEFRTGKKALITSKPVFDEKGNIIMVVTNVRDVTELYQLKGELEIQERLAHRYYSQMKELNNQFLENTDLVFRDKNMLKVLYTAKKAAVTDITVLLLGESGVGKEEIAKFIHKNSNRNEKLLMKINCGAIPENLIESEFFGYEKGSFTGASKDGKLGLFELADGGSLFLDEIGELPLNMQVKLLRVLQEGEIKRIGGTKPIKVDVRIISATNKNLEEMVKENLFREDLFYRLNVIPITIPPLRDRKQDIMVLTNHFLKKINEKYGLDKSFRRDVIDALYEYSWPGNVRELKNIVERVVVISNTDIITCDDLPNKILEKYNKNNLMIGEEIIPLKEAVGIVEKRLIEIAYDRYGNVRDAAKALKIDASTFVRKRKKWEK